MRASTVALAWDTSMQTDAAFALRHDGQVYRWEGPWFGGQWMSLGDGLSDVTSIAAASGAGGGVALFAISGEDSRLIYDGPEPRPPTLSAPIVSVHGTSYPGGGFAVGALGVDGTVWLSWQPSQGGSWTPWLDLATAVEAPLPTQVAALTMVPVTSDGLAVFVTGNDGRIHHAIQEAPNGPWTGWLDFVSGPHVTGGSAIPAPVRRLSAFQDWTGRLAIFAIGGDGHVWGAWTDAARSTWRGWMDVSRAAPGAEDRTSALPTPAEYVFSGARNGIATFAILAKGADGGLWHLTTADLDDLLKGGGWERVFLDHPVGTVRFDGAHAPRTALLRRDGTIVTAGWPGGAWFELMHIGPPS
jgi:hypothetical protein